MKGTVSWVHAGPGGAEWIPWRGVELVKHAGVVVCDPDATPEAFCFVDGKALVVRVSPVAPALIKAAKEGHSVVRLVAPGANVDAEVKEVSHEGIACEVIPAINAVPAQNAKRPLSGQKVVVTRTRDQSGKLTALLREQGAQSYVVPVIKIVEPTDRQPLADALLGLNEYDWLVFTSVNGVNTFFEYFFRAFPDLREIGGARIAAVGQATAARLKEMHLTVNAVPDEALGKNVVKALLKDGDIENLRICLMRAETANRELFTALEAERAIVDDIACYKTVADTEDPFGYGAAMMKDGAEWITFTSGSTVQHFHARYDLFALLKKFPATRIASIGPETTKSLAELKITPHVEAKEHSMEGLVQAMVKSVK